MQNDTDNLVFKVKTGLRIVNQRTQKYFDFYVFTEFELLSISRQ